MTIPWSTPTLRNVRTLVRDTMRSILPGADANVPNSVLRVMCDVMAANAHLCLQYIDWLAKQFLPDTSEKIWLDRHGKLWLKNFDGSTGRKLATLARGVVMVTGQIGVVVPVGARLAAPPQSAFEPEILYETLSQIVVGSAGTPVEVRALDPGVAGNQITGSVIGFSPALFGVDSTVEVVDISGGTDEETDEELRARVLLRIQQPPMGGSHTDYVQWALDVPGVTRAWAGPLEQGMGTVTIRFMMDDQRANGLPTEADVAVVQEYMDSVRPVAVKDCFVVAPIPYPINMYIYELANDNPSVRASIETEMKTMFFERTAPGATIYRSWIDAAISQAIGEDHHELTFETTPMPAPGYLPILGSIIYVPPPQPGPVTPADINP